MPEYNTRLRTNAQILPPRRLRQDEPSPQSPTPRRGRPLPLSPQLPRPPPPSPPPLSHSHFPPLRAQLHPDDATNKTFLAIGRALFSIENRAVTIKDLSYLTMKHGLVCQNASAASQAITTFIRNHLNRCRQDHSMPLLLSLPLTGTDADDRLAPALHSRSGGNSASVKPSNSAITNFRRGTTVWYLSEAAGAVCPFKRGGLFFDDIIGSALQNGTKRKREPQSTSTQPRKCHVNPSSSPPPTASLNTGSGKSRQFLPRVKLTLKLRSPSISPCRSLSSSDSELDLSTSENDGDNFEDNEKSESESPTLSTAPLSLEDDSDDSDDSAEVESSIHDVHDELQVISPSNSELYPDSFPIPSSSRSVPCNDPYPFYFTQNLCSSHLIKSTITSFRTALSNPSWDSRADSIPPSQSATSPPPDSEDEDEDFHNSMIGLCRDSVPVPEEDNPRMPKFEPISPKFIPGSVHLTRNTPELETPFEPKSASPPFDSASTPLETLPGFVLDPESTVSRIIIKEEEPTITLSLSGDSCHNQSEIELDYLKQDLSTSSGSINDPILIDNVDDVEVLGPETVRSREWDMAWSQFDEQDVDEIDADYPLLFQDGKGKQANSSMDCELPVSPCLSSPPTCESFDLPPGIHPSIVMTSTLSCSPAIIAVVVNNIWLYCTMLGLDAPLVRRIDNDLVNITQLHRFLQISFEYLLMGISTTCFNVSPANGLLGGTWVPLDIAKVIVERLHDRIPAGLLNLFLSSELGRYFPDLGKFQAQAYTDGSTVDTPMEILDEECDGQDKLVGEESLEVSSRDVCIRVEDLFDLADCTDNNIKTQEREIKSKIWMSRSESNNRPVSIYSDGSRIGSALLGPWEQNVPFLDEQEEKLFHSFVDLDNDITSWNQHSLGRIEKRDSTSLSPPPTPSSTKSNDTSAPILMNEKENSTAPVENRGRRNKAVPTRPVRRSTRVASKALNHPPLTRSRRKTK